MPAAHRKCKVTTCMVAAILLALGICAGNASSATLVLYFVGLDIIPPSEGDAARLEDLGMTVTVTRDSADLEGANLAGYDVVVLWQVPAGVIGDHAADLESYVQSGKGLFVHSPGGVGVLDYLPSGFEISVASQELCNPQSTVDTRMCVVDASPPLVSGFDGFDLSGALLQTGSLGPSYTLLAENCLCEDPSLAAGSLGEGRIVFDTGFFASGTLFPGRDDYITDLFNYLRTGRTIAVLQTTWSTLKVTF
jgi:hypothetical protein